MLVAEADAPISRRAEICSPCLLFSGRYFPSTFDLAMRTEALSVSGGRAAFRHRITSHRAMKENRPERKNLFCATFQHTTILFLACFFAFGSLSLEVQAQDRTRFLHWMYQDAFVLATDALPQAAPYALGSAALLAPTSALDPAMRSGVQAGYEGGFARYLDLTNMLGEKNVRIPAAAVFALSLATDDARFQDAAFTSLQSVIYSGVLAGGLKFAAGRMRPFHGEGPYQLAPFEGHKSFPSGHTTTAFALVTPWVLYYPHPATYALFALPAGTALARIAQDKHWPTDVLAGATIGFLTAYWLTERHQQLSAPGTADEVLLFPTVSPGHVSLHLHIPLN